jgi:hypothetical protein
MAARLRTFVVVNIAVVVALVVLLSEDLGLRNLAHGVPQLYGWWQFRTTGLYSAAITLSATAVFSRHRRLLPSIVSAAFGVWLIVRAVGRRTGAYFIQTIVLVSDPSPWHDVAVLLAGIGTGVAAAGVVQLLMRPRRPASTPPTTPAIAE